MCLTFILACGARFLPSSKLHVSYIWEDEPWVSLVGALVGGRGDGQSVTEHQGSPACYSSTARRSEAPDDMRIQTTLGNVGCFKNMGV